MADAQIAIGRRLLQHSNSLGQSYHPILPTLALAAGLRAGDHRVEMVAGVESFIAGKRKASWPRWASRSARTWWAFFSSCPG